MTAIAEHEAEIDRLKSLDPQSLHAEYESWLQQEIARIKRRNEIAQPAYVRLTKRHQEAVAIRKTLLPDNPLVEIFDEVIQGIQAEMRYWEPQKLPKRTSPAAYHQTTLNELYRSLGRLQAQLTEWQKRQKRYTEGVTHLNLFNALLSSLQRGQLR